MENEVQKSACVACGSPAAFYVRKNGFDLRRCAACRHVFIYPFVSDTAEIYGDDYFAGGEKGSGYVDYDADKEPMRPTFVEYLRRIEKLASPGTLLDVGAATGFFADIARSRGWQASGVEISDYAARIGRGKGLDIKTGVLSLAGYPEASFDVVTMWDVLEHFPDPAAELNEACRVLKPGGVLAINTPDAGSLYARLLGRRWHLLVPPEHVNYFSSRSVRLMLERSGFETLEISRIGKTFTLEYVLHIVGMWLKSSRLLRLAKRLSGYPAVANLSLPINLRDNMFVLARKR